VHAEVFNSKIDYKYTLDADHAMLA